MQAIHFSGDAGVIFAVKQDGIGCRARGVIPAVGVLDVARLGRFAAPAAKDQNRLPAGVPAPDEMSMEKFERLVALGC